MPTTDDPLRALRNLLGDDRVFAADETNLHLALDSSKGHGIVPMPSAFVFPRSTDEVATLVLAANDNEWKLVPQGGRTGLSGGAIACADEIVVSLSKMDGVHGIDASMPSIDVDAGVITATVQSVAQESGYFFPLDLAASGSSQIGGNIATNAGGIRVLRTGMMREHVLGLTVVTGQGEVLRFSGELIKDNSGPDLKQLFIGSEGTLGIITRATLKLQTEPGEMAVVLLAMKEFSSAMRVLSQLRKAGIRPYAFEYFDAASHAIACEHLALAPAFSESVHHFGIVEWDATETSHDTLHQALALCVESGDVLNARLAQNNEAFRTIWKYREGISESLSMTRRVRKNDVSVPLRKLREFVDMLPQLLAGTMQQWQNLTCSLAIFGHVGDGNLHVNLFADPESDEQIFQASADAWDDALYNTLASLGGSISAEHGIGLLKKKHLHLVRSAKELEYLRGLKRVFDPSSVLNPGKIFD